MDQIIWPDDTKRLVIIGHTGSGKSQAGMFHLSRRSWAHVPGERQKPWIVFNPKRDELIERIGMFDADIRKAPPTKPGLYNVHYDIGHDDDLIEDYMRKIAMNGNTGIYVDEGYSVPKHSRGFTRILTQGRSLRVPAIVLSQRPRWMDNFVWTEASYIQTFWLTDVNDRKRVREFAQLPLRTAKNAFGQKYEVAPPKYHSDWFDVSRQLRFGLQPVPDADSIVNTFHQRLGRSRKVSWV